MKTAAKPWSGRFKLALNPAMQQFHSSLPFDQRLYPEDLRASLAHVDMLQTQGIISQKSAAAIKRGLKTLLQELVSGKCSIGSRNSSSDDIHLWVEQALSAKIGTAAKELHTARSRNDQVCTDLRLYLRHAIDATRVQLSKLLQVLYRHATVHQDIILPGHTHFQPAQPITLSFYWLAHFFALLRDDARLECARVHVNRSPLGAGAFAGVNYAIDRRATMRTLGFKGLMLNAMDAVSARDFVLETLSALSILMVQLSRLCEELIIFANPNFAFITLSDAYSSGSSIMPNKKNPDALELIRGKSGRVVGALMGMLMVMKGLPLAYNRDQQEDKEGLFDAMDQTQAALTILSNTVETLTVHPQAMRAACSKGYLAATDIADYLVRKGLPFRAAHECSAQLVQYLETQQKTYETLTLEEYKHISPYFEADVRDVISLEAMLKRKQSEGSSSRKHVRAQLRQATKELTRIARSLKQDTQAVKK